MIRLGNFVLRCFTIVGCCLIGGGASAADSDDRPNIILIMADDLGFSDLGCYGGEIETPNLDAPARGGMRMTQFYNCAKCTTTRAVVGHRTIPASGRWVVGDERPDDWRTDEDGWVFNKSERQVASWTLRVDASVSSWVRSLLRVVGRLLQLF